MDIGSETQCKGPVGYIAVIRSRKEVLRINYGRLTNGRLGREREDYSLLWRGAARLFEDRIEWRLNRGHPFAAIVRIFTLAEGDRPLEQF